MLWVSGHMNDGCIVMSNGRSQIIVSLAMIVGLESRPAQLLTDSRQLLVNLNDERIRGGGGWRVVLLLVEWRASDLGGE